MHPHLLVPGPSVLPVTVTLPCALAHGGPARWPTMFPHSPLRQPVSYTILYGDPRPPPGLLGLQHRSAREDSRSREPSVLSGAPVRTTQPPTPALSRGKSQAAWGVPGRKSGGPSRGLVQPPLCRTVSQSQAWTRKHGGELAMWSQSTAGSELWCRWLSGLGDVGGQPPRSDLSLLPHPHLPGDTVLTAHRAPMEPRT